MIFLDIDGVVAPIVDPLKYGELEPSCVRVLNEIVARGEATVVISSSWRYGKSVEELQALLDAGGFVGRVVDKTPTDASGCTRGEEIDLWLHTHPVAGCVILDDHRDMGQLLSHLVQTDPRTGLYAAHVDLALERLFGDPPQKP